MGRVGFIDESVKARPRFASCACHTLNSLKERVRYYVRYVKQPQWKKEKGGKRCQSLTYDIVLVVIRDGATVTD